MCAIVKWQVGMKLEHRLPAEIVWWSWSTGVLKRPVSSGVHQTLNVPLGEGYTCVKRS